MNTFEQTLSKQAIATVVAVISDHGIFHRIVEEIKRNNEKMPHSTNTDKRAVVMSDLKIIFNDLAVPIGKRMLSILIDLAVAYLEAEFTEATSN